jgi:hypothetical protein
MSSPTVKFSFAAPKRDDSKPLADLLAELIPTKVMDKDGKFAVVIQVPTNHNGGKTFIFFDEPDHGYSSTGSLTWLGESSAAWLDDNYTFVGPLLPTETVTFSGVPPL